MEVKSDPIAYIMQSTLLNWSKTAGFTFGNTCTMETLRIVEELKINIKYQISQRQHFVTQNNNRSTK